MDTKLNRRWHIVSTQMSLLFDQSRTNRSIYYPPFNRSYRNGWEDLTLCTSYRAKTFHTIGISYIIHPTKPIQLLSVKFSLLLLLLHCRLSQASSTFPFMPLSILFSFERRSFTKNYRQRSHFYSEQWLSCACYLHSQLGFGRVYSTSQVPVQFVRGVWSTTPFFQNKLIFKD